MYENIATKGSFFNLRNQRMHSYWRIQFEILGPSGIEPMIAWNNFRFFSGCDSPGTSLKKIRISIPLIVWPLNFMSYLQ